MQTPPAGSSCAPAPDGCARHAPVLGEDPLYDGVSQTECSQCRGVGDPGARFCERYITRGAGGGGSIGLRALRDLAVASTFTPGSGGGASGMPGGAAGGAGGGALRITSESRVVLEAGAAVLARGGRGGEPDGGPGSGGVIVIEAPELRVARGATVSAAGGGRVGLGRLRLTRDPSRCTLEGGFSPPLQRGCAESRAMGFAYVSAWR